MGHISCFPVSLPMLNVFLHLLVLKLPSDESLEGEDSVGSIDNGLPLGRQANQTFPVLCESNNGRGRPRPFCIFDHLGRLAFHDRDARIRCTQINTNYRTYRTQINS